MSYKIYHIIGTLILVFIFCFEVSAQPEIPSAPSAAVYNYSKYADVAPNMYTGAMSENIPLGSVSAGPLQQAISLNYYFAGHRPSDLSGPEGLGFHLMAGGAITRQIRGLDDLGDNGWLETGIQVQSLPVGTGMSGAQVQSYINGNLDPESDVYSLQAGGLSIKFAMDHMGFCHTVPRSDIKIKLDSFYQTIGQVTLMHRRFKMTDTQGNKYYFGQYLDGSTLVNNIERTKFGNIEHTSSWYLYRIDTHDKQHSLTFDYEDHNYKYFTLQDCEEVRYKDGNNEGTVGDPCEMSAEEVEIIGKVLEAIDGLGSEVKFTYQQNRLDLIGSPKRLRTLEFSSGSFTKTYTFNHGYFTDDLVYDDIDDYLSIQPSEFVRMIRKLRLISIATKGTDNESTEVSIPNYNFNYYGTEFKATTTFPAYSTINKAVDDYGFANGAYNNNKEPHIIPSTFASSKGVNIAYGDPNISRSSNGDFSVATALRTLTLPTGSTIRYLYEPNSYFSNETSLSTPYAVNHSNSACNTSTYSPSALESFNLTAGQIENGWIDWHFTPLCGVSNPGFLRINIIGNGGVITLGPYVGTGYTENRIDLKNINPELIPGQDYDLQIEVISANGHASISFFDDSGTLVEVGGIRLRRRITNDDDPSTNNDIIRDFRYVDDQDESSGKIYKKPQYAYGFEVAGIDPNVIFSTNSIKPFSGYDGSHIGYAHTTIDYNGNGEQKSEYHTDLNIPLVASYPPVPEQQRSLWGQVKSVSSIRETDEAVLQSTRTYLNPLEYGQEVNAAMYTAKKIALRNFNNSTSNYFFDSKYKINTGTFRPDSLQTTLEGLSKTQTFKYGSNRHLQATRVSEEFKNGEIYAHHLKFTVDNLSGGAQIDSLISRNMISPNIDTFIMNGKIVARKETNYTIWSGNHPRPFLKYSDYYDEGDSNGQQAIRETDQMTYNSKGLITAYKKHGYSISNVFTYNVNSLVKTAGSPGLIRTFIYYPNSNLISSITEVDGTIRSYKYDGLMRLKKLTDPVGATTEWEYNISKQVNLHNSYILETRMFPSDINNLSSLTKLETYNYLDGLGRTQQTVGKGRTFSGKDQVSAIEYDNKGRISANYEIVKSNHSSGEHFPVAISKPKTTILYEPSPLNRRNTVTPPNFGKQTYTYGLNTSSVMDAENNNYPVNSLFKTTVKDGNNNKSIVYTDIQGRALVSRRSDNDETSFIDTKYTYEWRNLKRKVVPPQSTITSDTLNFEYIYDNEGKVIRKSIPSRGWVDQVYDSRDLLIGYRDNHLKGLNKWMISQYDNYGRTSRTGFHNSKPINGTTIPHEILTYSVYGTQNSVQNKTRRGRIQSYESRLLGTTDFIKNEYFYDNHGRQDSTRSNHILDLVNLNFGTRKFYDGGSNIVKERVEVTDDHDSKTVFVESFELDDDGRITAEYFNFNDLPSEQLTQLIYTDKDQILIKHQGVSSIGSLQEINYNYLDNQSLHKVNEGTAIGHDLFGYQINYNQSFQGWDIGMSRLNGDIKSTSWQNFGEPIYVQGYNYNYLNRLMGVQTGVKSTNTANNATEIDYNSTSYTYDERGNFIDIIRKQNNQTIDNLNYEYKTDNANQLHKITESGDDIKGFKLKNNLPYLFDSNGNMIRDPQKGITIYYNHLDLPENIIWDNGRSISFLYDADGDLHRKEIKESTSSILKRHEYAGPLEYIDGYKYSVMHTEGRIVNQGLEEYLGYLYLDHQQSLNGLFEAKEIQSEGNIIDNSTTYEAIDEIVLDPGFQVLPMATFTANTVSLPVYTEDWRIEYSIKDYLGNLKMVYSDLNGDKAIDHSTEILQKNDYFPYGMRRNHSQATGLFNSYQYNSIDHINDFDLNWSMAKYRSIDSDIGRWGQVDPSAENILGYSPYNSMNSNPISNVDPDGDLPVFVIPQLSFNGGLSFGVEVGIGVPGVLSASISGGYGTNGGYASIQVTGEGVTTGYGTGGAFTSYGYQFAGFSGGLSIGQDSDVSLNASYGIRGKGLTSAGGSGGLNYNFATGDLGYNLTGAYTYIFEKPQLELLTTYQDDDAPPVALEQPEGMDCLITACQYIGPFDYDKILEIFAETYNSKDGTDPQPALERLYGADNVQITKRVGPMKAQKTWKAGGNVIVGKHRNHAIVLNKIEQYKATYKYRKIKVQTRFKYFYMDPNKGIFRETGYRKNYTAPTFYINK